MDVFNSDDSAMSPGPLRITEIGRWIDKVGEKIRNDGIVAVKQPDIFSQARLTKYRKDFETEMSKELDQFHFVLSARIARMDAATTTSTTQLGAALSPGTAISTPALPALPQTPAAANLDLSKTPFSGLQVGQGTGNIGLEPTVYLDEKKRFLDHLNEIRRLSAGPDQSDSAGYGLYLMRLPVSITPGECTYHGHGADMSVTVEHEFGKAFLPSTIRNLVVNDLVAQLGPVIYEILRNGTLDKIEKLESQLSDLNTDLEKRKADRTKMIKQLVDELLAKVGKRIEANAAQRITAELHSRDRTSNSPQPPRYASKDFDFSKDIQFLEVAEQFARFITRSPGQCQSLALAPDDPEVLSVVANRLEALSTALKALKASNHDAGFAFLVGPAIEELDALASKVRGGDAAAYRDGKVYGDILLDVALLIPNVYFQTKEGKLQYCPSVVRTFYSGLYDSALPDDVSLLDKATGATADQQKNTTQPLATGTVQLTTLKAQAVAQRQSILDLVSRSQPSTRNPKQSYPISPREVPDFFLRDNLILIARDANRAMLTKTPRSTEVRNYLRQNLYIAFDAMSKPVDATSQPPILDQVLMDQILQAVLGRQFGEGKNEKNSPLWSLYNILLMNLERSHANLSHRAIGALCWAVAVDTVLLDLALREDVHKVLSDKGLNCPDVNGLRFYIPITEEIHTIFHEYVRQKWPILTFALDPFVDQQNLADSSNLKRDLQLAVAFAFSTGQINFNQANSFRRQIEQQSDTIALNRTIVAYAHGDNMFGFRFSPRFQNPPMERTNFGVIAHQLISGGPGPDYGTKKSKLEPGIRELTAVLLVPEFLQNVRMETAGNWFKLTDPEHLVIPTPRMLEQSRKVQELKQAVGQACNAQNYRPGDLRNLDAKINNLDAMLPMQTRVVSLPFENQATGFELFSEGESAMVPELAGFEGVDTVSNGAPVSLLLFGRYFSIHETRVIVSGLALTPSGSTTLANTSQSTTQSSTSGTFDIVSREVLQVNIPASGLPTVTVDNQQYLEVRVASPAGISNAVLIPVKSADASAAAAPAIAYDLNSDSKELDVFYQWLNSNLIATQDPGSSPLHITWSSPTGMAPKTLQATFSGTVGTLPLAPFTLPANSGTKDDYSVDSQQIVLNLFQILQNGIVSAGAQLPASLTLNITVQPYIPLDSMGYRVKTKPMSLATPLTVKFVLNGTGVNAMQGVKLNPPPAPPKKAAHVSPSAMDDGESAASLAVRDPSLIRTAQGQGGSVVPGPLPGPFSSLLSGGTPPVPPPPTLPTIPTLPSSASVQQALGAAGQALSTAGQTLGTAGQTLGTASQTLGSVGQTLAADGSRLAASIPGTNQPGQPQLPPIVMSPSQVVVMPSAPAPRPRTHSRLFRLFDHNRNTQAVATGQ
jgi:hypothetical protein